MNTGHDQCRELTRKIRDIFAAGFQADAATVHFINSTFDHPDYSALQALLNDRDNCDREGLIDLIISPDSTVRRQMESLLEGTAFSENEIQALLLLLPPEMPASVRIPGLADAVPFSVPSSCVRRFISQLNLTRPIPADIRTALEAHLPERPDRLEVLVRIRHSRASLTEGRQDFFPRFAGLFGRAERERWFFYLDFILALAGRWKSCPDMFAALGAEKEHCRRQIEKNRQLEGQLAGKNMETFMLQGGRMRVPADIPGMLQNIKTIDDISLLVWGRVPTAGPPSFQGADDVFTSL